MSTVAQQGMSVWFTRTPEDRPLLAYAEDMVQRDAEILSALARAVRRVQDDAPPA